MAPHSPPQGTNPNDSIIITSSPSVPVPVAFTRPRTRAPSLPPVLLPQPANMTATMETSQIETSSSSPPNPARRYRRGLAGAARNTAIDSPATELHQAGAESDWHSSPEPGIQTSRRRVRTRATRNQAPKHDTSESEEERIDAALRGRLSSLDTEHDRSSSKEQVGAAYYPHIEHQQMISNMEASDSEAERSPYSEPSPDPKLPRASNVEFTTDAFPRSPALGAMNGIRKTAPLGSAIPSKRNLSNPQQALGEDDGPGSEPLPTFNQGNAANTEPQIKRIRRLSPAAEPSPDGYTSAMGTTTPFEQAAAVPEVSSSDQSSTILSSEDDSRNITLPEAVEEPSEEHAPPRSNVRGGGKNRMLAELAPFNRSSPPPGKPKNSAPINVQQPRTLRNRNRVANTTIPSSPPILVDHHTASRLSEEFDSDGDDEVPAFAPVFNVEQTLRRTQIALGDLRQRYREACGDWERRNGTLRDEVENGKSEAEYWRQKYKVELNELVERKVKKGIEKATADMSKQMEGPRVDIEQEASDKLPKKASKGKGRERDMSLKDACAEVNEAMGRLIRLDPSMADSIGRFNPEVEGALTALINAQKARNFGIGRNGVSNSENGGNGMLLHSVQTNQATNSGSLIEQLHAVAIAGINSVAEDLGTAIEDLRSTTGPDGGLAALKRSAARKIKAAFVKAEKLVKDGFDDAIASSSSNTGMPVSGGDNEDLVRSSAVSRMPSSSSRPILQQSQAPSADPTTSSTPEGTTNAALADAERLYRTNRVLKNKVSNFGKKMTAVKKKLAEEVERRRELENKLAANENGME